MGTINSLSKGKRTEPRKGKDHAPLWVKAGPIEEAGEKARDKVSDCQGIKDVQ